MIKLYGFGRIAFGIGDTRDLRAQWALEETGLPYRFEGLDHTGGELDGKAFRRINPFGQLPVLDDEGCIVTESAAILLYLAEKSGKLIPADFQGRMHVTQWCFAALTTLEPTLAQIQLIDEKVFALPKEHRAELAKLAGRWLAGFEERLEGRTFIACDDFTVADMLLASVLRLVRKTDLLAPYPRLTDFYARALTRPAWQRTLAAYAERHGANVADIR